VTSGTYKYDDLPPAQPTSPPLRIPSSRPSPSHAQAYHKQRPPQAQTITQQPYQLRQDPIHSKGSNQEKAEIKNRPRDSAAILKDSASRLANANQMFEVPLAIANLASCPGRAVGRGKGAVWRGFPRAHESFYVRVPGARL
jgi:hypothetical protein